MIKTGIAKLLTLKLALAAGAAAAGGGFALAASTGHLPLQAGGASPSTSAHSPAGGPAAPSTPSAATHQPSATPSPSLRGLCRAYTAGAGANPGKALDSPAFTALVTAAGSKDNVATFCTALLGAKPGHNPSAHPSGGPSAHPSGGPTTHPAGGPTAHPSGKPTTYPSGKPTALPTP